jgi:RimJ/RimL family protein N-acetyltransferase
VKPILLDFPDHLETERLLIRGPRPGDGAAIHEAIQESLENLLPWMPWAHTNQTPEDVEAILRRSIALFQMRDDLRMNMYRKSDGLFVGGTGLHEIDWDVPRFEIGYWVRKSLEGQGYVTEAVKGLTTFCFETLHAERVEILMDARNTRSAAVAERAGYIFEAILPRRSRDPYGKLRDTKIYRLLKEDFYGETSKI